MQWLLKLKGVNALYRRLDNWLRGNQFRFSAKLEGNGKCLILGGYFVRHSLQLLFSGTVCIEQMFRARMDGINQNCMLNYFLYLFKGLMYYQ